MSEPKLANRLRGRRNKLLGEYAEEVVVYKLRAMGFQCVVRLQTGWRVQRKGAKIVGASPMAKVVGDFRAVGINGRSVMGEVKHRPSRLVLADFAPHNRQALIDHDQAGGLSLIAWHGPRGTIVLPWAKAFRDKGSLTWDEAVALSITGTGGL